MNSEPLAARTSEPAAQVTPDQALHLAIAWHRDGRWDAAESVYDVLLQENPKNANALHFLGVLKHQRGDHEQALALIQRSLTHDSSLPDWHSNLGNVLLESRRLEEAAAAYERARALAPDRPELHNNLGVLRREQGRLDEAEAAYRHAVALKPDFSEAHTNLAWLLHATGRADEAVNAGWEALLHSPQFAKARKVLGMAYARLGRMDEAVRVYQEWLDEEPDNAQARHFLRACSGEAVPERAPEQGFVLNTHGRYSHDQGYLSRALQQAGLEQVVLHSVHLRMESARPVLGWLVAARKAAVAA